MTLRSTGAATKEALNNSDITKTKRLYTPGDELRSTLETLKYEETDPKYKAKTKRNDNETGDAGKDAETKPSEGGNTGGGDMPL